MPYPSHLDALVADMSKRPAQNLAAHSGIDVSRIADQAILLGRITEARREGLLANVRAHGNVPVDLDVVCLCYDSAIGAFALSGVDGAAIASVRRS